MFNFSAFSPVDQKSGAIALNCRFLGNKSFRQMKVIAFQPKIIRWTIVHFGLFPVGLNFQRVQGKYLKDGFFTCDLMEFGMMRYIVVFCLLSFSVACGPLAKNATTGSSDTGTSTQASSFYYDFDDILVPRELSLIPEKSIFFESPSVKTGVLAFDGRVDAVSLFNFFLNNMPKDNWKLRSYFKYGVYLMVFEKADKDCIMTIVDSPLKTQLQIWVAPRLSPGETLSPALIPKIKK
jgi:hypothetical protein